MSAEIATFEKVKSAVLHLRSQGTAATADRVITHLGGGSKATVLRHLRALRELDAPVETLPTVVFDLVKPALAEVFAAGAKAEAERTAAGLAHLTNAMRDLDAQVEELAVENTLLAEQITALKNQLSSSLAADKSLRATLTQTTKELHTARSKLVSERDANTRKMAALMSRIDSSLARISQAGGVEQSPHANSK